MAREKVQDKYRAIIDAAISVFAERGFWDTPTSLISKTAGVADGTLFNYFKTKDDLIHEVYLELKKELAAKLLNSFPENASVQDRMRYIWNQYIEWGVYNPDKCKVLNHLSTSYEINEAVKLAGSAPFAVIEQLTHDSIAQGVIRDYPVEYLGALIEAHMAMTIQFISTNMDEMARYQALGFDILWKGITC